MTAAAAKAFTVDVPNVGTFTFKATSVRTELAVGAEYIRLTEGVDASGTLLGQVASAMATIKVRAVDVPEGWDIDAMDPLDTKTYEKILAVHRALGEREQSFRAGTAAAVPAGGAPTAGQS